VVSFRYHLTSLAAALVALAVGIVVGTTSLSATPAAAPAAPSGAATATSTSEEFAEKVQSRLLRNALPDQRVLVLLAPDAPAGSARSVVAALKTAGSTVTGQVRLLPTLLDPSGQPTVDGVMKNVAPTAAGATPLDRAAGLLARALVTSDQGTDLTGLEQQKALGALTGGSLVAGEGALPTARATLVLLISGPGRGSALAALAAGFQSRVGTVVFAPPAAAHGTGVVAALRNGTAGVSDVDTLGTTQGLVAAVLALSEQASGSSGHYGTGPKATAVVPDLG
jgi:hypothetical protein